MSYQSLVELAAERDAEIRGKPRVNFTKFQRDQAANAKAKATWDDIQKSYTPGQLQAPVTGSALLVLAWTICDETSARFKKLEDRIRALEELGK